MVSHVGLSPSWSIELVLMIQTWSSLSPQSGRLNATPFSIVIKSFPLVSIVHVFIAIELAGLVSDNEGG